RSTRWCDASKARSIAPSSRRGAIFAARSPSSSMRTAGTGYPTLTGHQRDEGDAAPLFERPGERREQLVLELAAVHLARRVGGDLVDEEILARALEVGEVRA